MRTISTAALTTTVLLMAACSSTPLKTETPASVAETPKPAMASQDNRTVAPINAAALDALDDPKGMLAQRSVYFDFDNYSIKPEFTPLVTTHGAYLTSHKSRKIIIQGHADERGGSEYNLALGQKRADAVRRALVTLGVQEAQMEAVSLGKEKPKALGHDEASWAENRRADLVYNR